MDIEDDWRRESLCGLHAWIRELTIPFCEPEQLRLAVWCDDRLDEWEWEVIDALTDSHILGSAATSCNSAKRAAEAAAASLALSECLPEVANKHFRPQGTRQ
jgi:hypothetical protein